MVNNPKQQDVPAFYSPLTHDQHAQLGRIAILWGQADMFVDNLLTAVLGIAPELRSDLFNDKPMGSKIDKLMSRVRAMDTSAEKTAILSFLALVDDVKSQRNECFHGVWGFWVSPRGKVEAAAQHHRQKGTPFKASALPKLERALCQISHQGMLALAALGEAQGALERMRARNTALDAEDED